jgi:hypothetical protein
MGAMQLTGERLEFGLGDQRIGDVVGGAYALGDRGGERVGQPVSDVTELMELMPNSA